MYLDAVGLLDSEFLPVLLGDQVELLDAHLLDDVLSLPVHVAALVGEDVLLVLLLDGHAHLTPTPVGGEPLNLRNEIFSLDAKIEVSSKKFVYVVAKELLNLARNSWQIQY